MAGGAMRRGLSALRRKRIIIVVAAVLVAGVLATLAAVLGQRMLTPPSQPPPSAAAKPSTPGKPPLEFTEFRSEQGGFALSYPKSWRRVETEDPQVALVATNDQNDSFLVRVVQLDATVGPDQLPAAKQLADRIVKSNESVKILTEPAKIELAGLPGYFYFYSFEDPASKQRGAHSHFFLFKQNKMITLVFQSIPSEQFPRVAPTFDRITSSFRLLESR